jgi:type I restriction enzyme S subunit
MSEWKEVMLTEITTRIGDGLHGTPNYDENGDYYFINGNNLLQGKIVIKPDTKKVNEEEYIKYSKPIDDRTILLGINGTIGNLAFYNNEKCVLGKSACYINLNDEVDKQFIYYHFLSKDFQTYIIEIATGTTIPNVPLKGIREYSFELPELPEQKAIASVLSSLDDKIDLLHRQNATLEKLAETLFRQWFVEEAKEEWESKPLSSIANFLNGLACQKFPPKNDIERLPVLKIKELSSGITENSDWATTKVKPEYIVKNGDVIFAWSASLMVKIWDGQDCILNQHLFKVTTEYYPKWFYSLWCKHHLDEFIAKAASHATTMGHIKRSDLDNAIVLVPSDDEMTTFTEIQSPIIDKIISNNNQIRTLAKMRDTLLPKLMNGEIKVKS